MAKISRAQGPSMTTDEFEGHEGVLPVRIRRPEVGPMRRVKGEGEPKSVGTKSSRSTEDKAKPDSNGTNNPQGPAPLTENPSVPVEAVSSDADSVDGAPTQTESQPSGRRKPARKAAKAATPKTPSEPEPDDSSARVRFTDDDF
jgi:hypothetical protein